MNLHIIDRAQTIIRGTFQIFIHHKIKNICIHLVRCSGGGHQPHLHYPQWHLEVPALRGREESERVRGEDMSTVSVEFEHI